jgi:hypothetical protein
MFQVWQDVPTATISYTRAGAVLSVGSFTDGDVSTAAEFNEVAGSCDAGTQSPIIFDADGTIFSQLIGDPNVIGFAGICSFDAGTGRIVSGAAALNGRFQDGINDPWSGNYELPAVEFDTVFIHEFGHFSGLDHSQINVNCLNPCGANDLAGLPTMFPFLVDVAQRTLAPDDIAWISRLYPEATFATTHGTITGTIFFSDGITQAQGINVIARSVSSPRSVAVSVVSGFRFTGNPGQSVTGDNPGSSFGSRDPLLIGYYEIPVPAGAYTVDVESIDSGFAFGSGVGPLSVPIPSPGSNEFWNSGESATDDPTLSGNVTVTSGGTVSGINIILNGTATRFDSFESTRLWWREPVVFRLCEERVISELVTG